MIANRRSSIGSVAVTQVTSIAALFAIWEIAGRWLVNKNFLSPPSRVLAELPRLLEYEAVAKALEITFLELIVAFVGSILIGLAIGLLVGMSRAGYRTTFPIIMLIYATPQITILPIFILYFGLGPASKIAFGISHGIFPIILNVTAALRGLNPMYQRSAHAMGASHFQILLRIILPAIIPALFTGTRLAMSITLLGVLLAELYVSTAGIGYFTRQFAEDFDPTKLFGLLSIITLMAVILNESMRRIERRASWWKFQ